MSGGGEFVSGVELRARQKAGTLIIQDWRDPETDKDYTLSIMWDPDTQYSYWWDGEVVSYAKVLEYLRAE